MTQDKRFIRVRSDQLLALESQLQQEVEWLQQSAQPVNLDQTQFGRLSRIDAIGQQEMQKAAVIQSQRRLQRVRLALQKLVEDDYGWCDECGEPIEPKRLAVQPEALYCLLCQDKVEHGS